MAGADRAALKPKLNRRLLGALLGPAAASDGVRALLRLLPRVWAGGSAALAALITLQALLAAASMMVMGGLLAAVAALPHAHAAASAAVGRRVLAAFGAMVAVRVLQQLAGPGATLLAGALGRRVTRHTTAVVLDASLRPLGVGHLEDPRFADEISLAQGVGAGTYPPSLSVTALAQVATARLGGVAAALLLAGVVWWAPLPLAVAWRVVGGWLDRQMRDTVRRVRGDTPALRRAAYLRDLGLEGAAAKELRVFGLGPWLVDRFTAAWTHGMRELLRHGHDRRSLLLRVGLLTGGYGAVLGALAAAAAHGSLGIARMMVGVQAAFAMANLGWTGDQEWILTGASAAIPHAQGLARRDPDRHGPAGDPVGGPGGSPTPSTTTPVTALPGSWISFDAVSFRYPGQDRPVLDRIDLRLPAGESIALVGENGAGKTTLVKLLARCHEPDAGRISVDGIDLRALDPLAWRRQLAVVFQDFLRFELSARDNVALGSVEEDLGDDVLEAAARLAGAEELVAGLPHGWDTLLSRRWPGGVDLSGGQWQRLALARALLALARGARVLVLDEPTAQLDVRAEAELYEHFLDLTRGRTTILVSHRFSTVRLASRICVLAGGRVVEHGGHEELLAQGGRYAHMFRLQAARFAGEPHA